MDCFVTTHILENFFRGDWLSFDQLNRTSKTLNVMSTYSLKKLARQAELA
jgi:hypothetical protein